jgi:hypothetical protein
MTHSWQEIRQTYADFVRMGLPLRAMIVLVDRIEQSQLRSIFAWTSMHDLFGLTNQLHWFTRPKLTSD